MVIATCVKDMIKLLILCHLYYWKEWFFILILHYFHIADLTLLINPQYVNSLDQK